MIEPDAPTAAFRAAMLAEDLPGLLACVTDDVTLSSPITDRFRFTGRDQLGRLMRDVFDVVDGMRYTDDVGSATERAIRGVATVRGEPMTEAIFVRLDDRGLITSLELFIRPMPGLTTMAAAIGPRVAAQHGAGRSLLVRGMIAPLAFASRAGEGLASRLARPR